MWRCISEWKLSREVERTSSRGLGQDCIEAQIERRERVPGRVQSEAPPQDRTQENLEENLEDSPQTVGNLILWYGLSLDFSGLISQCLEEPTSHHLCSDGGNILLFAFFINMQEKQVKKQSVWAFEFRVSNTFSIWKLEKKSLCIFCPFPSVRMMFASCLCVSLNIFSHARIHGVVGVETKLASVPTVMHASSRM